MLRASARCIVWIGVFALSLPPLAAHGDIQEQIALLTRRIQQNPRDAELYLKRAELHRALREWDRARADYDRSAHLNPRLTVVDLARGQLLLEAGQPEAAKIALDRFLARHPDHGEALVARARASVKLGSNEAAVSDFTRAVTTLSAPRPEYYIERAQAVVALGSARRAEAIRGLDEGIRRLGPVVTLELFAIDLEVAEKRYDPALARLDRIVAQSARQEVWLARRGEILAQAERHEQARAAYREALAAIETLPSYRRSAPAVRELEQRLHKALQPNSTRGGMR